MEKATKKIVIELRVRLAEDLFKEFSSSKEKAVQIYLESAVPEPDDLVVKNEALTALKFESKQLIDKDLAEAIKFLKSKLDTTSNEYDDLISLSSKFNRTFEFLHKGIIDFQTAEQEFVRIGHAILQILKGLSSEHLKKQ
jgi:hypothetical protein